MALTKEEKAKIIKEFGKNENDTGSLFSAMNIES